MAHMSTTGITQQQVKGGLTMPAKICKTAKILLEILTTEIQSK